MNDDTGALLLFLGGGIALGVGGMLALGGVLGAIAGHPKAGLTCGGIGLVLIAIGAKAWGLI